MYGNPTWDLSPPSLMMIAPNTTITRTQDVLPTTSAKYAIFRPSHIFHRIFFPQHIFRHELSTKGHHMSIWLTFGCRSLLYNMISLAATCPGSVDRVLLPAPTAQRSSAHVLLSLSATGPLLGYKIVLPFFTDLHPHHHAYGPRTPTAALYTT